jgi:amino acid adenylation domain-containing protein/non-ribosomal peptide synthase protein (TIGR01720 family)
VRPPVRARNGAIVMENVIEGFPLSPQQRRLYGLQQRGSRAYVAQCAVLVEGNIKAEMLRDALGMVVSRHEMLRTTFHRRPGMLHPIQVISGRNLIAWREIDACGNDGRELETAIKSWLRSERDLSFALEQGPMIHATLASVSSDRRVLSLTLPAICADGRTLGNMVREISQSYASLVNAKGGTAVTDGESDDPTQYTQFSEWQNELLESDEAAEGKRYWLSISEKGIDSPALSLERKSSGSADFDLASVGIKIGPGVLGKLDDVAAEFDVPRPVILLAGWMALLWRLTGEPRITVGAEFDGRKYEELEGAMGLFARRLPVGCDIEGERPFGEILKEAARSTADARAWQEYFAPQVTGGNVSELDFFPIAFEYSERAVSHRAGGALFTLCEQYNCIDRFKIKLSCLCAQDSIQAELQYDKNCFRPEDAERIGRHFANLLPSALENPQSPVCQLRLLDETDLHQLLTQFNRTFTDEPVDDCIHHLFERQVERSPHRPAVVFDSDELSYGELNARSNRLAHLLLGKGVGPDVPVILCLERSVNLIAGLLGILKAGGAYIPLDPDSPKERLAVQMAEMRAPVLITQQTLLSKMPEFSGETVCLGRDWSEFEGLPSSNPDATCFAQNLAYVIYTSGSTGIPNGVGISHRSLVNYARFICGKLQAGAASEDTPLHFATISTIAADLGNTCVFPSLISGGCLHVLSYEFATDGYALAEYLSDKSVDVLKIVPSHLNALLAVDDAARILPRKYLLLGGEALSFDLVRRIGELSSGLKIINHYGPTETTVGSLTYSIDDLDESSGAATTVPIGRPLANSVAYILDEQMKPAPIGAVGELYLGGEGVARGYLGRPEQTANRFVPNPFGCDRAARLFKTGDMARYLSDGSIEFLGRRDNQIKIRGYRIELGEIEARLRGHSNVRDAVVVGKASEDGHARLVAYIVAHQKPAPAVKELRSFLGGMLPEYMLPSAFITMEALPLTANGKVNRRALPDLDHARPDLDHVSVEARTPVEELLCEIWSQVLRIEKVGVSDNFFELGGDSISSLQIIAKANRAGLKLTPKQLFEHATIAELAAVASFAQPPEAEQEAPTGAFPLTPIQRWFFERDLSDPNHFNLAVMLELRQPVATSIIEKAVRHLIESHSALRLRFVREQSGWRQFVTDATDDAPFALVDFGSLPERDQTEAIRQAASGAQASLNLSEGPLLRVAQFDFGARKPARLLVAIHHLVVDGVSWRILLEDLETASRQLIEGGEIIPPIRSTSFREWASRLARHAQTETVEREFDYWKTHLGDGPRGLPVDYVGGENSLSSARAVSSSLSVEKTRALLEDVPSAYNTQVNDALLAALAESFTRWTGDASVLIDLEGHGREEIIEGVDVSRTVGWFTTHFPVRLTRADAGGAGETLKSMKEQLRAIPNRGIGYGLLRYMSNRREVVEQLEAQGDPQVSFNYLGQLDQALPDRSLFRVTRAPVGQTQSARGRMSHLLRINAAVIEGRLEISWTYSENIHRRETIQHLADQYVEELEGLIEFCQSEQAGGYTPSDFPGAKFSQGSLEKFLARIGQSKEAV